MRAHRWICIALHIITITHTCMLTSPLRVHSQRWSSSPPPEHQSTSLSPSPSCDCPQYCRSKKRATDRPAARRSRGATPLVHREQEGEWSVVTYRPMRHQVTAAINSLVTNMICFAITPSSSNYCNIVVIIAIKIRFPPSRPTTTFTVNSILTRHLQRSYSIFALSLTLYSLYIYCIYSHTLRVGCTVTSGKHIATSIQHAIFPMRTIL